MTSNIDIHPSFTWRLLASLLLNAVFLWSGWVLEEHPSTTWRMKHQVTAIITMTASAFTSIALLGKMEDQPQEEGAEGS